MKTLKILLPLLISTFLICAGKSTLLGIFTLLGEKNNWSSNYFGTVLSFQGVLAIITSISIPLLIHKYKFMVSLTTHFTYLILVAFCLSLFNNNPSLWSFVYITTIISTTIFFIRMETVVISEVSFTERSRALALYWLSSIAGFAMGPFIVSYTGINIISYIIAMVIFLLAYLAVFSKRKIEENNTTKLHIKELISIVYKTPLIWAICLVGGYTGETLDPFIGVMGLNFGYSGSQVLALMSYFLVGGFLSLYIVGWLIDIFGIHKITIYTSMVSILIGGGIILSMDNYNILVPVIIIWGASCFGVSLLTLSIVGSMFRGNNNKIILVSIGTIFYDLGSVLGSLLNGIFIDNFGAGGLIYSASLFLSIAMIAGYIHHKRGL